MRNYIYLTLFSILIIVLLQPCNSRHRKHHARVIKQTHKKPAQGSQNSPQGGQGMNNNNQGSGGGDHGSGHGGGDGMNGGQGGGDGMNGGQGGQGGHDDMGGGQGGHGGGDDMNGGGGGGDHMNGGGGGDGDCTEEPPPPPAQGARYLGYANHMYWWVTNEPSCKDDAEQMCSQLYPGNDEFSTNLATGDTSEKDAIAEVLEQGGINEPVWIATIKKLNEDRRMMLYKFGAHGLRIEDVEDQLRKKRDPRQALVTRTLYKHKIQKRQSQVEVNSMEVESQVECGDGGMMIPNMEVHYPWIESWQNGTPCVDTSGCQARVCNVTTVPCEIDSHPTCQVLAPGEFQSLGHGVNQNETANCTIINSGECTVVCERCDIVTEPECWAAENKCEVVKERQCTMTEPTCNVTMQPCSVTRPPCVTKQEPCEVNSTDIIECQIPEECATPQGVNCTRVACECEEGQDEKECTRMECTPLPICLKPEYCRQTENGTLKVLNCPPPTTFCPPEIVQCPAPAIECSEPVWSCTDPEIYCPPPQVICTQPVVNCTAPTISCPNVIATCQNPNITCGKPQYTCPEPLVQCEESKSCLVKPTHNIPMCKVECNPEDDCSCMKIDRNGDSVELSEETCDNQFLGLCSGSKYGDDMGGGMGGGGGMGPGNGGGGDGMGGPGGNGGGGPGGNGGSGPGGSGGGGKKKAKAKQ